MPQNSLQDVSVISLCRFRRRPVFLLLALVLLTCLQAGAQSSRLDKRASISLRNASVEKAFDQIETKWDMEFSYSSSNLSMDQKLNLELRNATLKTVLDTLSTTLRTDYRVMGRQIVLFPPKKPIDPPAQPTAGMSSLTGQIKDEQTGEPVADADIWLVNKEKQYRALSDEAGNFAFDAVQAGHYKIHVQHISNERYARVFQLKPGNNPPLDIRLKARGSIEDVVIQENKAIGGTMIRKEVLDLQGARAIPTIENDILATAVLIPGVKSVGGVFSSSEYSVHGGAPGENLFLVDNVPIFMPFYVTGKSVFNPEMFAEMEILTHNFPARYGGALSSVANFRTRRGNMEHFQALTGFSFNNFVLLAEGPIKKNKASIIFGARSSILDRSIVYNDNYKLPAVDDANWKLHWRIDDKNVLNLSGMIANARLKKDFIHPGPGDPDSLNLFGENIHYAFNWLNIPHENVSNRATLYMAGFNQFRQIPSLNNDTLRRGIAGLRDDLSLIPWKDGMVRAGYSMDILYEKSAGFFLRDRYARDWADVCQDSVRLDSQFLRARTTSYLLYDGRLTDKLSANVGLIAEGDGFSNIVTLSPRLAVAAQLDDRTALRAGYGIFRQAAPVFAGIDGIRPGRADHFSIGFNRQFEKGLQLDVQPWLKTYTGLPVYDSSDTWSNAGSGNAYGLDVLLARSEGILRGRAAYTLSWANRRDHAQTMQNSFRFDQRHSLDLALAFHPKVRRKWWHTKSITAVYHVATGMPFTPWDGLTGDNSQLAYAEPYAARFRANHYLNLRFLWEHRIGKRKRHQLEWFIDIWNFYNHRPRVAWAQQYCGLNGHLNSRSIRQTGTIFWPGLRIIFNETKSK